MLRRRFLASAATATLFSPAAGYARVLGAADRVRFAVFGVNGRGRALVSAIAAADGAELAAICDVDARTIDRLGELLERTGNVSVRVERDFRRLLGRRDVDAVAIATPEQWHTPMAILALKAGKHVYLEKPCSFCPAEGELLVAAQARYGKLVQMGNQQRSAPSTRAAVERIHAGAIGRAYVGKAWYANKRGSIGAERPVPVPAELDWDLWQGPAPRRAYAEPWVHYDWHWHRAWGTGEINNNGTHEIDICRWALGVDLPTQVSSSGGRFHFDDAWQWFDTQYAHFLYDGGKHVTWDGRSCNPAPTFGRGRGAYVGGTEGYALLYRNGSTLYNLDGEVLWEQAEPARSATLDTVGAGPLDTLHLGNLVAGITRGEALHAPIADARRSQLHCHLGNLAQDLHAVLDVEPASGRIVDHPEATARWGRDYEPGWEPSLE